MKLDRLATFINIHLSGLAQIRRTHGKIHVIGLHLVWNCSVQLIPSKSLNILDFKNNLQVLFHDPVYLCNMYNQLTVPDWDNMGQYETARDGVFQTFGQALRLF